MSERWAFAAAKTNATRKAPRNLVEEASHMPAFRNDAGRLSCQRRPWASRLIIKSNIREALSFADRLTTPDEHWPVYELLNCVGFVRL
jgi:hypothetical protein